MTTKKYHLDEQPIPDGFQIFEQHLEVTGLHHRKTDAAKFISAKSQWLEFQRDPDNVHDPNAIKVIGCGKGFLGEKRRLLGYVPKEIAAAIVQTDLANKTVPRLYKTYMGKSGFVEVEFQLLGPKSDKDRYKSYWDGRPATDAQKEFYRFMGKKPASGLTSGEAQAYMDEVETSEPERFGEWEAYSEILEELSDPVALEDYDLKKVSSANLRKALKTLKDEGYEFRQMADEIDIVIDKLTELRPEVKRTE